MDELRSAAKVCRVANVMRTRGLHGPLARVTSWEYHCPVNHSRVQSRKNRRGLL
jgi:hypothetical protein